MSVSTMTAEPSDRLTDQTGVDYIRRNRARECARLRQRRYREANRELDRLQNRERKRNYRQNNLELARERDREYKLRCRALIGGQKLDVGRTARESVESNGETTTATETMTTTRRPGLKIMAEAVMSSVSTDGQESGGEQFKCQLCRFEFKREINLNKHYRNVHGVDITCDVDNCFTACDDSIKTMQSMNDCVKLEVQTCNRNVDTLSEYTSELSRDFDYMSKVIEKSIKNKHNCDYKDCNQVFMTRKQLTIHKVDQHLQTKQINYENQTINKSTEGAVQLKKHVNKKHGGFYVCEWSGCEYRCLNEQLLTNHIKRRHTNQRDFRNVRNSHCDDIELRNNNEESQTEICGNNEGFVFEQIIPNIEETLKEEIEENIEIQSITRSGSQLEKKNSERNDYLTENKNNPQLLGNYISGLIDKNNSIINSLYEYNSESINNNNNNNNSLENKSNNANNDLAIHKIMAHKLDKMFECNECEYKTKSKPSLYRHKQRIHLKKRNFRCDASNCGKQFCAKQELKRHSESVHSQTRNYTCHWPECKSAFILKADLVRHTRVKHTDEREFKCDKCDKRYATLETLRAHVRDSHCDDIELRNNNEESQTEICGNNEGFVFEQILPNIDEPLNEEIEEKLEIQTVTRSGSQLEMKNSERNDHLTENKTNPQLLGHYISGLIDKNNLIIKSTNEYNSESFNNNNYCYDEYYLKSHVRTSHVEPSLVCDWSGCTYRTRQPKSLKYHRMCHANDRPHVCQWPDCGRGFVSKDALDKHTKRVHSNDRTDECPQCGKQILKVYLKAHIMRMHTDIRPFECDASDCGKRFSSKQELKWHSESVHSEARNYSCHWPECESAFKIKQNLTSHIKNKHMGIRKKISD